MAYLSLAKRVVALLGGAFDPLHTDHLRMAQECLRWQLAEEVWLMVAPDVRWDKKTVAPAADRIEMIRRSIEREDRIICCDFEIESGEFRGTLHLLERLQEKHPETDFRLLVGSDSYPGIPHWRDPTQGWEPNGTELLRRFSLLVWPRPGSEMPDPEQHLRMGWKPLLVPPQEAWYNASPTSSSAIRSKIEKGEPVDELIPRAVKRYIDENQLYRR